MPRALFEKTGNAIFISHLDLMRLFQRAFQRSGLPLTHTQGFNPRPSVSIALPLSLGVESGCELMNHSNAHGHFNSMSTEEILADVNACNDKIEALTGVRPTLIRCPFGEYDDHVITAIRSIGMEPIQWDVDSLDWKGISAAEITKRVTSKVAPGSIVLFHNAGEHTPEALPGILDYLLAQGYQIIPISEILLTGDYTIDHTGRQSAA